ncbi:MAG: tetratricopeptide repeat protein [Acidobacteria bacterium]|nr:tetratricopeptide repeat protein [Acidobacteriota bacterium]MBI3662918.1 tetratricopeptide repeat protein [Acidobacteriota bacterium]
MRRSITLNLSRKTFRLSVFLPLLLGLTAFGALAPAARAQASVSVDSSRQLFAVMCALHAAGFESNVASASFHPVRARLREVLLRKQGPATDALREFYRNHEVTDPAATLARYVSFALVVGPPPTFKYEFSRDELPPDALALENFNEILAAFDREAGIEELWRSVEFEYQREISRAREPVGQIVLVATSYLREVPKPRPGRSFTVIVEPMIGGRTTFRNVGDRYAIMLRPGAELPLDDIRHAYLHFLLDPLPYRYKAATNSKRIFLNYAGRAPRLAAEYKDDFEAFLTECLVKAVELRLSKLSPEKLAAEIGAAEANGFVLVRALHRELVRSFDQSAPPMSLYFADLLRGISIGEEGKRLETIQFAAAESASASAEPATELSELDQWLVEGDRQIAGQDGAAASATFERILEKYPGQPRALYGLAVALVLRGEVEKAKDMFQDLVSATSAGAQASEKKPPFVVAWSHVHLGRIYDLERNRELALSEYRAALAVEGAPDAARIAARRGIEKGTPPPSKKDDAAQRP